MKLHKIEYLNRNNRQQISRKLLLNINNDLNSMDVIQWKHAHLYT